jgi:hypothetical protein
VRARQLRWLHLQGAQRYRNPSLVSAAELCAGCLPKPPKDTAAAEDANAAELAKTASGAAATGSTSAAAGNGSSSSKGSGSAGAAGAGLCEVTGDVCVKAQCIWEDAFPGSLSE